METLGKEDGTPPGWISRAKFSFEIQNVTFKEKLRLVFNRMEGNDNHWFKFWH